MSFNSTEKSAYKPIPEGTHTAVCSALIDLGLQDAFGADKPQLLLRFEFPGHQVIRDGVSEPMVKWQFYTNSLNKKANLRRDLEGWRDRGFTAEELVRFDVRSVVGHPCSISIIHDSETGKDKIRTISKYMGSDKLKPQLEVTLYSKSEGVVDQWDILPDWIKDKIEQARPEDIPAPESVDAEPFEDDSIPF
jgi:hypothetical protein